MPHVWHQNMYTRRTAVIHTRAVLRDAMSQVGSCYNQPLAMHMHITLIQGQTDSSMASSSIVLRHSERVQHLLPAWCTDPCTTCCSSEQAQPALALLNRMKLHTPQRGLRTHTPKTPTYSSGTGAAPPGWGSLLVKRSTHKLLCRAASSSELTAGPIRSIEMLPSTAPFAWTGTCSRRSTELR